MSLPSNLLPVERAESVRRLYAIADMVDAIDMSKLPMTAAFQLGRIKAAADYTARWVQSGLDLTSEERNAA